MSRMLLKHQAFCIVLFVILDRLGILDVLRMLHRHPLPIPTSSITSIIITRRIRTRVPRQTSRKTNKHKSNQQNKKYKCTTIIQTIMTIMPTIRMIPIIIVHDQNDNLGHTQTHIYTLKQPRWKKLLFYLL